MVISSSNIYRAGRIGVVLTYGTLLLGLSGADLTGLLLGLSLLEKRLRDDLRSERNGAVKSC